MGKPLIKAVTFDFFGVLTQESWFHFLEKYQTQENADEIEDISHRYDTGKLTYDEYLAGLSIVSGASVQRIRPLIGASFCANEVLFQFARKLKKRGYKIGIISNTGRPLENYLPAEKFKDFDVITLSCQVGSIKPEPAIYRHHLEKLGIEPHELVFIDDREKNCEGAKSLGIEAILYRDTPQLRRDIAHILA